jgi:2-keto-4-pentenoate hydratase/2-oxohepta-3-ene-1,7-dioic acid hydratase in catechol pathway
MRLVSFLADGGSRPAWGLLRGETILDASRVDDGRWPTLRSYLRAPDPERLAEFERGDNDAVDLAMATLAPVVPDPEKILCVGLNFESHRLETGRPPTEHPVIFSRFADTQVGHGRPLRRPRASTHLDYEGELALVIGSTARNVAEADALDCVAGYAPYMDATLRDFQNHTHQYTPGKNFPATAGFGPALVTADEVPDYRRLSVRTRVDGEVLQEGRLDDLTFTAEQVISYCSRWTVLRPGDVIVLGTPAGIGARREPPRWLVPGEAVEVEIPGVGTLANQVRDEED